jgi:hypothetical protein
VELHLLQLTETVPQKPLLLLLLFPVPAPAAAAPDNQNENPLRELLLLLLCKVLPAATAATIAVQ